MKKLVKYILTALISFAVIVVINFALPRLMPGDPVALLTGIEKDVISQAQYDRYYTALGLDKSLSEQFGIYLKSVFDGSLGYSYHYNMTVSSLIGRKIGATLQIAIPAIILSSLTAMFLGLIAGYKRRRPADNFLSWSAIIVNAVPTFLLAMVFLILFAFEWGIFPSGSLNSAAASTFTKNERFLDRLWHLCLPILTLSIVATPSKFLLMRNTAAAAMDEKYVVYSRAKGLNPSKIRIKHIFPNISQPFITMVGMNIGALMGGSIIIESIFSINGMGLLISTAITNLDYPVLQGTMFLIAVVMIAATLVTDIIVWATDPKTRAGGAND